MTLKYNILWIDDQPESVEAKRAQIKEYIEEEKGFDCHIEPIISYNEYMRDYGAEAINTYDLLIVDFTLDDVEDPDNHSGFDIIKDIRDNKIYTEIIFYSSHYENLRQKIQEQYIEGIFSSARDELSHKVQDIIDVIIKKVQDVNNLRGLIMAEVAELDIKKEQIIQSASKKITNKELEKYTLNKIKSSSKSNHTKAEKHLVEVNSVSFDSLFAQIGFVDSNKKAMTIGEALEKLKITTPVSKQTFTQPYIDNILSKRNLFAHVKVSKGVDASGNPCAVIGDIPFTEDKCIEIRKEIRAYKKILDEIEKQI
ncbi:MAG: hypothetical protein A2023_02985 [Sulfuricurvum sp. GWF2_44_89]|uniref:hypothetical protein n=1 Tax=Sulfuricurvum sp. RIFOXYD2_FULL_44_160 TaxID=1802249 RepID=UPI0008B8ED05|nr:hypothetical protein [Sulfuricurvum sp. RIFOXYD2_FULL_44_160]OHD78937.1 MAG: hypothetical protein A2023_02985 [Sulfuricurvum sp. GWF2_44_89]OHD92286.1 MAG: hypothetical protein A2552_06595 [Sulfuricurvum sp. RIFOXYD2_FULL_44_160]